jgi:hypothetical protein
LLDNTFEKHLPAAFAGLRDALSQLLVAVRANVEVPNTMTRQFRIDKSLAWKLSRVVKADDPFSACLDVPGPEAMRGFIQQMSDIGAPAPLLRQLETAVDEFVSMIKLHCGDRATLEMMAASADNDSERKRQQLENFRRMLFRGASAAFGVQASLQLSSHFVKPNSQKPDRLDFGVIGGFVGFRRIRVNTDWPVAAQRSIGTDGSNIPLPLGKPIDAAVPTGQAPVLRAFCSGNLPSLEVLNGLDGVTRYVLPDGPVGLSNAVNVLLGWTHKDLVDRYATKVDKLGENMCHAGTPVEALVHEVLLHNSMGQPANMEACLYQQLPTGITFPTAGRERGKMVFSEPLRKIDVMSAELDIPQIPQRRQILNAAAAALESSLDEFNLWQIRMSYPPVPSTLVIRFDLAAKA